MMNDLVSTRTALAEHHRAAHSAEQLGGEQVIVLGLVTGRSAAVLFDFQLHFLKQVLVHDGRDAVGHHNVLEVVFTDVPFVRQQRLNTVVGKLLITVGGHATVVQPVHQFFHSCAIVVPLKGFYHKGSFQRVDLKKLLFVHLETNGNRAAVVLPLQNILGHAAHNFFRKFCRVVFSHAGEHTLDHDTRRAVRDRLRGRYQLDMISFQLVLIVGRIIAVSGKTVKLPDQHDVKQPFFAVLDHLLEIRAVVGFCGKGAVNVVFDHGNAVLFGISRTFTNLPFDGFFALIIAGIAGVNHGSHGCTSLLHFPQTAHKVGCTVQHTGHRHGILAHNVEHRVVIHQHLPQPLGALRLAFHQRAAFRQDVQRLDGFCNTIILSHSRVRLQQTVSNIAVNLPHIAEGCMGDFYVILLHRCCSLNCANALAASTVSPF